MLHFYNQILTRRAYCAFLPNVGNISAEYVLFLSPEELILHSKQIHVIPISKGIANNIPKIILAGKVLHNMPGYKL